MNQWQARETEKRDARVCIAVYKGRIGGESPLEQLGGKLEIRKMMMRGEKYASKRELSRN